MTPANLPPSSKKRNNPVWWWALAGLLGAGALLLWLYKPAERTTCDSTEVAAYMTRFAKAYMQVTYPTSGRAPHYQITHCQYRKGFYVVDAEVGWTGNECHIPPNGECEVGYTVRVHFYDDGRLYGFSKNGQNGCGLQHEVCGVAGDVLLSVLQAQLAKQ